MVRDYLSPNPDNKRAAHESALDRHAQLRRTLQQARETALLRARLDRCLPQPTDPAKLTLPPVAPAARPRLSRVPDE